MAVLTPVTPYSQQRNRNMPKLGDKITVDFEGEVSQVEVTKITNWNYVWGTCLRSAVSRNAGFRAGDLVAARREWDSTFSIERWKHVTDRDWRQLDAMERMEREENERVEREQREAEQKALQEADATLAAAQAEAAPEPEPAPIENDWTC